MPIDPSHATNPSALKPIEEVAGALGLEPADIELYGGFAAKVSPAVLKRPRGRPGRGRLVLVSAMTPTPAGEGKTTTAIGLAQGLARLGESACLALRQPSLGPCFGSKGGATGGGRSRLVPGERIDLHFTGDFHAVGSAHNLLAALIDNHLHFGNRLGIDPRRVVWPRVLDMNDRALRSVVLGLGGLQNGVPREGGFIITAASEVMAMLCLTDGLEDLGQRLDRTLVAWTAEGAPVVARELRGTGSMLALLRDAVRPNLVQTCEGVPALVHGGPFANIAHGCSSVLATRMALHLSDWAVTEAGFGTDLGAEKFFDIAAASSGLDTAAVVVVATIRALRMHGHVRLAELGKPNPEAVARGLPNLEKHVENVRRFGEVPIVALNLFPGDTEEEIAQVRGRCEDLGAAFAVAEHYAAGGDGAVELARAVMKHAEAEPRPFQPLYRWDEPVSEKLERIATAMYGARGVVLAPSAVRDLSLIERHGFGRLPVCIAKTQGSLSEDPKVLGRPAPFDLHVRGLNVCAGAGFIVALAGDILLMPGLPSVPRAQSIDVRDGRIVGLEESG
jgi:formate--tetrahydrofolate ligase